MQPQMENSMEVPQKSENRITIRSSNPTPGHISRQNSNPKRYMQPCVHSSTVHKSPDMKATSTPINRGTNQEDGACAYSGLRAIKKNDATCRNTDGPREGHPERSQTEGQIYPIWRIFLKSDANELIYKRETDSQT